MSDHAQKKIHQPCSKNTDWLLHKGINVNFLAYLFFDNCNNHLNTIK